MGKPKKQTSPRKTGLRRSQHVIELARRVNSILSQKGEKIKVFTTKRETGKAREKATVASTATKSKPAAKKSVKKDAA